MSEPFAFAAAETPMVRGYSIGPHHVDWICVKCGAVGAIEETGPFALSFRTQCRIKASEQMNYSEGMHEHGEFALRLRSERDLYSHLQGHIRFEDIRRIKPSPEPGGSP